MTSHLDQDRPGLGHFGHGQNRRSRTLPLNKSSHRMENFPGWYWLVCYRDGGSMGGRCR